MREDKKMRLYMDIHILQVAPASCINRDDTGTPKSCVYGGTSRMRVSSQCWKRAVRMYMQSHFGDEGVRTKQVIRLIAENLEEKHGIEHGEAAKLAMESAKQAGLASEREDAKETMAFFSSAQIEAFSSEVARIHLEEAEGTAQKESQVKKRLVEAVMSKPSGSELLFGRMFASAPSLSYDAACQVAHAFSVNAVRNEYDYFTAVDDIIAPGDHSGSGFLDTKSFDSGILYRYANVNLSDTSELVKYDSAHASKTARDFAEAFVMSMPTGSMNSYANATLPEKLVITLREDTPVSYAPAFAAAIKGEDIVHSANDRMMEYAAGIDSNYGSPIHVWILGEEPLSEILDGLEAAIERRTSDGGIGS